MLSIFTIKPEIFNDVIYFCSKCVFVYIDISILPKLYEMYVKRVSIKLVHSQNKGWLSAFRGNFLRNAF